MFRDDDIQQYAKKLNDVKVSGGIGGLGAVRFEHHDQLLGPGYVKHYLAQFS